MTTPLAPKVDDTTVQDAISDPARLEALHSYDILDTEPEPAFDRITDLAAAFFEAPVSIINFIGKDRQWFKSCIGVQEDETALDISFCIYTVTAGRCFVVEDLTEDPRFADNPFVVEKGIRFYAGMPLVTPDGHRLGTLCVLDTEPRSPSEEALARLEDLAAMVVDELELRHEHAERERTAAQLQRSRELLRQSQQLAHVGGWEYDVRSDTLSWTDETYRIHDLPPGRDVEVDEALAFYTPDAQATLEASLQTLIDEGGTYDEELQMITDEGETRWVRTIGTAHREDGETVRLNGAIQDITEQRRAEQELRSQKEVLRTIFDNIPVMIALFDAEGNFQLVNQEFERLLGWNRDHVASQSDIVQHLLPDPDDREAARQFIEEAKGQWAEFDIQGEDGTSLDILGTVVALRDGRRIGIALDVTAEKERKKQLRLLEAAVEHTRLPVLITEADPLDDPGPRIVYTNAAFAQVSGYAIDEAVGQSPRFLQGEQTDRAALDRIRAALEANEPTREVVKNYRKDGTPYWNDLYITPVPDDEGTVTHYVSIQDDVTDRMERRQELKGAKEAAEQADQMKAALLSNMNHEFRTPLTSIISFSKLIADSPDLAENFAPRILGGGRRLLRTLNTAMDFAELEGGHVEPAPVTFALGNVVASVLQKFRDQAERASLSLEWEAPDGPVTVRSDRHLVERLLTHLVSNAVKFTESGGVTVRVREQEEGTIIEVVDTGVGIPPEAHGAVFHEFYQVSGGNDRTHEGNGLGLTIAKRMVEKLGGTIQIDSVPEEGTQVTVRLPRAGGR
jgi:PAS domain S-box-containing protein